MNCPSLVKEWLKDHDTRLINFVLDTVMEFVVESFIEHLKSSHLSLLLSVKEMVETKKKDTSFWEKDLTPEEKLLKAIYSKEEYLAKEYCDGYNQALSDLQSLLDSEINKIKEIWEE